MKQVILSLAALVAFALNLKAQVISADLASVIPYSGMVVPSDTLIMKSDQDTAIVRIGQKDIKVINHDGGTEIIWGKEKNHKDDPNQFYGHWQAFEFGINGFDKENYNKYEIKDFMSIDQGKSVEFNTNFYVVNIGLQRIKNNIGLVSGMGLNFNSYRFENPYTIKRGNEMTEPVFLEYENLKKSKLSVVYLNVPLLLEFQTPFKNGTQKFISFGLIAGVKLDSHTKVKYGNIKDKDHNGFNLNPFKCSATARIGYKSWNLYGTYSLTPLFKSGKGPELTPFSIGLITFWDRKSSKGSLGLEL